MVEQLPDDVSISRPKAQLRHQILVWDPELTCHSIEMTKFSVELLNSIFRTLVVASGRPNLTQRQLF